MPHLEQKAWTIVPVPNLYSFNISAPLNSWKSLAGMGAIHARDFVQIEQLHRNVAAFGSSRTE